jgi:hypothetical protein
MSRSGNTIVGTGSILVGGHIRKCRLYVLATADAGGGAARRAAPLFSRGMKRWKSRVPDTFQLSAILPLSAFWASREISNIRVFNTHEYSDSRRIHKFGDHII